MQNNLYSMWIEKDNTLYQKIEFPDFAHTIDFIKKVAAIAEELHHHPKWLNEYTTIELWLSTHESGGITDKDHQLAARIDQLLSAKSSSAEVGVFDEEMKLYADGGSRGNPGPSAGGFVLFTMDDQVALLSGKYLGVTTNNQAEYHSLKGGLEAAIKHNVKTLHVHMDSLLVINQMKGIYKVKNRELWPIYQAIKDLLPNFKKITFTHVPRELNTVADAEVNKALDAALQG